LRGQARSQIEFGNEGKILTGLPKGEAASCALRAPGQQVVRATRTKRILRQPFDVASLAQGDVLPAAVPPPIKAQDDGIAKSKSSINSVTALRKKKLLDRRDMKNMKGEADKISAPSLSQVSHVPPVKNSVILRVARKLERKERETRPPRVDSFAQFLAEHARVKTDSGYVPYHFAEREALRPIVERLDLILASSESDASQRARCAL
jgi:hypothetical protein